MPQPIHSQDVQEGPPRARRPARRKPPLARRPARRRPARRRPARRRPPHARRPARRRLPRAQEEPAQRRLPAKKGQVKKCSKKKCSKKKCSKKKCAKRELDGRSLIDRARDSQTLKECHRFIEELNDAIEQTHTWLNEMHTEALSRRAYAGPLRAADRRDGGGRPRPIRARISELEGQLKKSRRKSALEVGPCPIAVLERLAELSKEIPDDPLGSRAPGAGATAAGPAETTHTEGRARTGQGQRSSTTTQRQAWRRHERRPLRQILRTARRRVQPWGGQARLSARGLRTRGLRSARGRRDPRDLRAERLRRARQVGAGDGLADR